MASHDLCTFNDAVQVLQPTGLESTPPSSAFFSTKAMNPSGSITPTWAFAEGLGHARRGPSGQLLDGSAPLPEWTKEDALVATSLPPSELQTWLLHQIDYHQRYTMRLSEAYNAASLIHRILPPEIMMEVFSRLRPDHRRDIAILHVCRHWRSLALRTAEFWASILCLPWGDCDPRGSPKARLNFQFFSGFLELSASRKISPSVQELSLHTVDMLAPHCYRLHALDVTVSSELAGRFFNMVSFGMPRMQHLIVHHKPESMDDNLDWWSELLDIQFPEDALASLHVLHIPSIFLITALPIQSVRTLKIGGCDCNECHDTRRIYTLEVILAFLRRTRQLTILHFMNKTRNAAASFMPHHPVDLPALTNLVIDLNPAAWVSSILEHLNLPLTTVIRAEVEPHAGMFMPPALRNHPHLAAVDRVYFDLHIDEPHYVTKVRCKIAGHLRLSVSVKDVVRDPETRAHAVDEAFATFASPNVTDVELFVSNSRLQTMHCMDSDRLTHLLEGFPAATRLCVWRAGIEELPAALESRQMGPDDVDVPALCQGLKQLIVRWRPQRRSSPAEVKEVFRALRAALSWRMSRGYRLEKLTVEVRRLKKTLPPMDAEEVRAELVTQFKGMADNVQINADTEDWAPTASR